MPDDASIAVPQLLEQRLAEDAERELLTLVAEDGSVERLSGAQLAARAAAFAAALGPNPRREPSIVCISLYHGLDLHAAFVGALWAGHIPTMVAPPSPRMEPARYAAGLRGMLDHVGPACAIVDATTLENLSDLEVDAFRGVRVLTNESVDEAKQVAAQPCDASDVVLLQHSSGTTGLQKGIPLTSAEVHAHNAAYAEAIGATRDDVIASWLPLYHDMGFIACFVLPLLHGIRVVQMSPFDWVRRPLMLLEQIHAERASLCWLPNFAFSFLAQQYKPERVADDLDLGSIRLFVNSSEPVMAHSMRDFLDAYAVHGARRDQLTASYAMAENVYGVTQSRPGALRFLSVDAEAFKDHRVVPSEGDGAREFVSNGPPLEGTELCIRSSQDEALPDDRVGEILLRGHYVFSGYYERDDLTAEATTNDGWYRTGDLGFLHEGELYVTGRSKDLVIIQGRNFYPNDFEELVRTIDGVDSGRVVAFGVDDPNSGTEGLVILVEPEEDEPDKMLPLTIRKRVAQAFDCTPRDVKVVPKRWLIKSTSGKLARAGNREKYLAEFTG